MDIKQQTKNVAAQGRFGDSMLLHVNPAEVKGLASQVPLTTNPETGQPEAFLPFLAPIFGSMLGTTFLTGSTLGGLATAGLSKAAAAGIGAGLATYAQTGGSGSKALLSGLTAGFGTKALEGAAAGVTPGVDAATTGATDAIGQGATGGVGTITGPVTPPVAPPVPTDLTAGESLKTIFSGGYDEGMKNLATAAMSPSGLTAGAAAGTAGVIASQEAFERQMAQLAEDEEERKRRMYEMYPEQIPMASGGRTGFQRGGQPSFQLDGYLDFSNPNFGALDGIGGFNTYTTPSRRTTRPIGRGFMPGFMPEYSYFTGQNPSATALGYDPLGNFQNPQSFQGGYSQPSRGRGGFLGGLFGRGRGMQPMPPRGGFRNEGGSGFTPPPPPQFAGYGNPFMQSASYQGYYGVPQMQQMINPYAAFSQMPIPYQPYQPYEPPVETPPDDGGGTGGGTGDGTGGGTGGIGIPPIGLPPGDIGGGRKGAVTNPDPVAPPDDFVNPIVNPPVGGPVEPPITPPITMPPMPPSIGRPGEPPINVPGGGTPGFYDRPTPPLPDPIAPPPTITIPIEGGADVTIPDYSRPQPPRPEPRPPQPVAQPVPEPVAPPAIVQPPVIAPPRIEPPMRRPEPPMSIGGPGGGNVTGREELELANTTVGDIKPPKIMSSTPIKTTREAFGPVDTRDYASMSDDEIRKLIPQISYGVGANRKTVPIGQARIDEFRLQKTDPQLYSQLMKDISSGNALPENYDNPIAKQMAEKNQAMRAKQAEFALNNPVTPAVAPPPPDGTPENPFAMQPVKTPFVPVPPPIAPPVMPSPGQRVGEPSVTPFMPKVIFDGPTVSMEEAQASAIANGARRSLASALPDVPTMPNQNLRTFIQPTGGTLKQVNLDEQYGNQQFTSKNFPGQAELKADAPGNAPQPIGQAPQPPQTGGIPITGGGPLGSGILPEANLPSGTNAPTAPAPRAIQIPSGPAMGGISAVPTPAAPSNQRGNSGNVEMTQQPKPTMSGGIFGAPMFAAGGDTDLPNEGLKALAKTEKGREAVEAMGYQEGGATDMMQDPVTQNVIMFILGEIDDENAINAFVEKYGAEQFMFLRDKILKQAAGNPDAQTEGLIEGMGNSGMADDLPMNIGDKPIAAVSQDEYIVPADVVSMLGDGSSDAGSKRLDGMLDRVRMAKTGGKTQAPPLNPNEVLPA